jgi:hypothetical protein
VKVLPEVAMSAIKKKVKGIRKIIHLKKNEDPWILSISNPAEAPKADVCCNCNDVKLQLAVKTHAG